MKKARINANDEYRMDYEKGEVGFIDGYVMREDVLCAVVIIDTKRIVLVPVRDLEIITHGL